jgi:replicative DNA helicase
MIVLAARPAIGKSTMGLDIARSAAIRNGLATVIFSLEMSRTEITMRMLSAEARIPLQKLRQGRLEDTDWTKMARTMGELTDAPLFIDDSPNMSLMEIRAKCRRLKQRNDLKLVVIDYLQLMSSGKRVESRQQEVSEFSRAIKLLAKELEVPVIAISQLNRGSEQRTDKRPQMSDLRESGCLTRDTRVLRADTGAETTMGELFDTGASDVPVWSLDDSLRYVRRHLTHVFSTGIKPVFKLTLASGKQVRATANHPFLTYDGWMPLEQLGVGARVGVPRHVPAPEQEACWTDEQVVACARRLGAPLAGSTPIPDDVFHLPKRQIALLVHELWREGSEFRGPSGADPGTVAWAGASSVAVALARLLLRFGISVNAFPGAYATGLALVDADDRRRFLQEIGVERAWTGTADALLDRALADSRRTPERLSDHAVWRDVERALGRSGPDSSGSRSAALSSVASLLDEADLDVYAINDLVWDAVVEITPDGDEEVFDATVVGNHNFVANGIAVHNSIEQDADMVILLHREDAYEKESPRAGEADFIVAKHRNGPTDTITVAFQGHYSRFVDMAQS